MHEGDGLDHETENKVAVSAVLETSQQVEQPATQNDLAVPRLRDLLSLPPESADKNAATLESQREAVAVELINSALEKQTFSSLTLAEKYALFLEADKERAREYAETLGFREKLVRKVQRARAVRKVAQVFKDQGLPVARQQATELLTYFEESGSNLIYRRKPADNSFAFHDYKAFLSDSSQLLPILAHLENPLLAIQRLEKISGHGWQYSLRFSPNLGEVLSKIEQIPEEKFTRISDELRASRYLKIEADDQAGEGYPDLEAVFSIFDQGGLSEEQKSLLIDEKQRQLLTGSYYELPLNYVINNPTEVRQDLLLAKEIARGLFEKKANSGSQYPVETATVGYRLSDFYRLSAEQQAQMWQTLELGVGWGDETINDLSSAWGQNQLNYRLVTVTRAAESGRLDAFKAMAEANQTVVTLDNIAFYDQVEELLQKTSHIIDSLSEHGRLTALQELPKIEKIIDRPNMVFDYLPYALSIFFKESSIEEGKYFIDILYKVLTPLLLSKRGQLDITLVRAAYVQDVVRDPALLDKLSAKDQIFCRYLQTIPVPLRHVVLPFAENFDQVYEDGKEKPELLRLYVKNDFFNFMETIDKEKISIIFGVENAEKFLSALPKANDERRNAFTHNPYDRTSQLVRHLQSNSYESQFDFLNDFNILTAFVTQFGLAKSSFIYHHFKNLYLYEHGQNPQLDQETVDLGVLSSEALVESVKKIKTLVISEQPLIDLSVFSPFELELLKVVSGKSSHRFDGGRPPFEQIVADFSQAASQNEISPVPAGYKPEKISLSEVKIEFNAELIAGDFDLLRDEILEAIEQPDDAQSLVKDVQVILAQKILETEAAVEKVADSKKPFIEKRLAAFKEKILQLEKITTVDDFMMVFLDIDFDKTEKKLADTLARKAVLRKVFQVHFSPGFIENLSNSLRGEITPESILSVINVIDELVKQHALNLKQKDVQQYWSPELVAKFQSSAKGRQLHESFQPYAKNLKAAVDTFNVVQGAAQNEISIIPDRGFMGEMSGYLADVCYTAEYPLLKPRPELIPYKFVKNNGEEGAELIGSVLVFEVTDQSGEPCLLVRGFDVPQESAIDIATFIEKYLDKLADIGKERGKKKILIPGVTGAISNYQMTIHHLRSRYIDGQPRVTLKDQFNFNSYHLTDNCYVARDLTV